MSTSIAASARPAPLACLECRRMHLRCDGAKPNCTRCISRGSVCDYTPSRRGRRRNTKRRTEEVEPADDRTSPYYLPAPSQWNSAPVTGLEVNTEASNTFDHAAVDTQTTMSISIDDSTISSYERQPPWIDDEQLVNLYYLNFHVAHPILLTKNLYWGRDYPHFLKAVVEFIGSHFSPCTSTYALRRTAANAIRDGQQNIPEMIQARLLFAIALFARNEVTDGRRMLEQAIDIALELGMHRHDFATSRANVQHAEEESMRRTWYELYITDGYVAAFQRKPSFRTNTVDAKVMLPCDDGIFDGEIYPCATASRADFENSTFSNEEMVFSSFCYRIEAVRLLGRVLAIAGAHGVHRDRVQAVDNALAAFVHHLPDSKSEAEIINTYGELDELMFQAHTIIQYATILLHFPRSDLISPASNTNVVPGSNGGRLVCPCSRQRTHAIKAIDASKTLSMLAALRSPVQGHSPFFIHALALGAVVQISISANHSKTSRHCLEQHYDRVKLMLGVLKSFNRHWSIAGVLLRALNKMASTVFQATPQESFTVAQQNNVTDSALDACAYDTPTSINIWPENFGLQDLQELIGLETNDFCL
jgi:hypothetical protein